MLALVREYGEDGAAEFTDEDTNPFDENDCHPNDWQCFRLLYGVNKADAEAEATAVLTVRSHFKGNWQAAMTFMERKHPDRWKRRDLHEVAAVDRATARNEEAMLTPAAQAQLEQALMVEVSARADVDSTAAET